VAAREFIMSLLLTSTTSFLGTTPAPVLQRANRAVVTSQLQDAAQEFVALPDGCAIHRVAAALHRLAAAIEECESAGLARPEILPWLADVRALHARSPFVQRLQTWPQGYAGDFETVEWLCDAANRAEAGTVAWAIEQVALQSPVAQQHRNKVRLQADAIRTTLDSRRATRIASIGCGGCRDLRLIAADIFDSNAALTLVDADEAALAFASDALRLVNDKCTFVHGRVPRVLPRLRTTGPFDLVVAGGLFDYLPDRWAIETLKQSRQLLTRGGRVLFSNMARGNPYRAWIEYLAEWFLIERTEDDLRHLLLQAGFEAGTVSVTQDGTGLAHIVTAGN
jgi:extracellular factor (EF) 3-hydroxypalmitic acid methyl ester biosynthesis protein